MTLRISRRSLALFLGLGVAVAAPVTRGSSQTISIPTETPTPAPTPTPTVVPTVATELGRGTFTNVEDGWTVKWEPMGWRPKTTEKGALRLSHTSSEGGITIFVATASGTERGCDPSFQDPTQCMLESTDQNNGHVFRDNDDHPMMEEGDKFSWAVIEGDDMYGPYFQYIGARVLNSGRILKISGEVRLQEATRSDFNDLVISTVLYMWDHLEDHSA